MRPQTRIIFNGLDIFRVAVVLGVIVVSFSTSVLGGNSARGAESVSPAPAEETILIKFHLNKNTPDSIRLIAESTAALQVRALVNLASAANPSAARAIGLDRWYELTLSANRDRHTLADQLGQWSVIEVAEVPAISTSAQDIPDDPFFDRQYALHNTGQTINNRPGIVDADLDGPEVFEIHEGNGIVTVAVIDTGVDPHAEYYDRLLTGYNTVENNENTADDCPHGTHVAGIIAARGNNGLGIAGLNWSCNILPVRVFNGCVGSSTDCAEGILFAADYPGGVAVINLSLAFYTFSQFVADTVTYAHANDIVLVAAAGHNQGRRVAYPAALPEVIAISATGNTDEFESFSNFGPEIELAAPGRDIYSTWVGGTYLWLAGTSMASPQVAGTAALVRSFAPSLSNYTVRQILFTTAQDLGTPGWDEWFGYGRVNAHDAVQMALQQSNQLLLQTSPRVLQAGAPAALVVNYAEPDHYVFFAYSFRGIGSTEIRSLKITLNLQQPKLAGKVTADHDGRATLQIGSLPANLRNKTVHLQAAQQSRISQLTRKEIQ